MASLALSEGLPELAADRTQVAIELREVSRRFDRRLALDRVSLTVGEGEVHAVLGPNGAGKTTLLRILTGLLEQDLGDVRVLGIDVAAAPRALRQTVGLVPSGDRTFYLRLSGLENLVFFARLHGMGRRAAVARARSVLDAAGLLDVAELRVAFYSHGMQKRLSVARALLADPAVLVVDEGTHDLDPARARDVRDLIRNAADTRGLTAVWATQRLDEIKGFADRVTLLDQGRVRFDGTVSELVSRAASSRYVVTLSATGHLAEATVARTLGGIATVSRPRGERGEFVLSLGPDVELGTALHALLDEGVQVLTCREAGSAIEGAFLSLTSGSPS